MKALLTICLSLAAVEADDRPCVVIVVGAPGAAEYKGQFERWAGLWQAAAGKAGAQSIRIGRPSKPALPITTGCIRCWSRQSKTSRQPLWIVLIGHGTYDGREAKFNLQGPDVTDAELADWLDPGQKAGCRDQLRLGQRSVRQSSFRAQPGGRRGDQERLRDELHAIRPVSRARRSPTRRADLDKDGQVSLLEAYLTASSRVEEYYRTHSQLASEHALLDDNGDQLGTPASWFKGVHATQRAKDGAALDGIRAHQLHLIPSDREREMPAEIRQRRDELESSIAALRDQKEKLKDDEYYARLEKLMVELARLYREVRSGCSHQSGSSALSLTGPDERWCDFLPVVPSPLIKQPMRCGWKRLLRSQAA